MKGVFITFEGSEGSGKSTQSKLLYHYLKAKGYDVIYLREPGGTQVCEKIRRILLDSKNSPMRPECELLLYIAARAQVTAEIILPALKAGKVVICDRFLDSTLAYQGYGLGMNLKFIKTIAKTATFGIKPDLTILFDLPTRKGLSRCGKVKDRIERRSLDYHRRVKKGYLKLAALEPGRIKVIKADGAKDEIQKKIRNLVSNVITRHKRPG